MAHMYWSIVCALCCCALGARHRLNHRQASQLHTAKNITASNGTDNHTFKNTTQATARGYPNRASIPSGCALASKLPNDARCLFDDQCQSNFCCPYFRSCQGQTVGSWTNDPLLKEILVAPPIGQGNNGCEQNFCKACDFQQQAQSGSQDVNSCLTFSSNPNGSNAQPITDESSPGYKSMVGLWDLANPACNCDLRFVDYMKGGCWVPECHGGSQSNINLGYVQMGQNCNCGNPLANFWPGRETPEACAAECKKNPACKSFALWTDATYNGYCRLFDAMCQNVDGHTQGQTTCSWPVSPNVNNVGYNFCSRGR